MFFPIFAWKNFEEAGFPGWKSAVPIYNYFVWLRIIEKPNWWFIFLIIPFFNVFMVMLMVVEMVKNIWEERTWRTGFSRDISMGSFTLSWILCK